jgi:ParB-like chromosome segregation protein Spo0J
MMETTTEATVKTIEFAGETYQCPFADLLPPLSTDERAELLENIKQNGIKYPILVDEAGNVIDGHHRLDIARELGLSPREVPIETHRGLDEVKKREIALTLNTHRRQLDRDQKRKLIGSLLKADPEKSDRAIADQVGVDNKTVATVRDDLEASEEIPHVEQRTDKKGRKQQAKKPAKKKLVPTGKWSDLAIFGQQLLMHGKKAKGLAKKTGKERQPALVRDLADQVRKATDEIVRALAAA